MIIATQLCSACRPSEWEKRAGLALAFWALALWPQASRAQTTQTAAVLEPVKTSITVAEKITTEAPASVVVLQEREIESIPGVNLDDRLRMVPGFSLFRRSSSLVSHPTTQGVSLRGITSTGASRTLVLWDGVPVNDPFGGWVYWNRFSPEEMERIEISRGASTSVFGDRAMGGVIALFSREPERHRLHGSYEGGNRDTHGVSAGYSHLWSRFAMTAQGRAFTTDGYFIVPERSRGAIDRQAGARFVGADTKIDYLGGADRLFLKFDLLAEERANGTVFQNNSTGLGTIAGHYVRENGSNSISLLGYHTREEFRSAFSAILAGRNSERLTMLQTVPSEAVGGAALWRHSRRGWNWLAGGDALRVEGNSNERLFPSGFRTAGGTLLQHGAFAQTDFRLGSLQLFAGARHQFTGQDRQFFSPSGGFAMGRGRFRARGSLYRSFRAPTLNELFREFRVGNAVTMANPALRPEKLFGAEIGLDIVGENTRATVTAYRNTLADLVTNVTLSVQPNLIVRQRQNEAAAMARGVEFEVRHRWRQWHAEASYLFADARFGTGERTPQIPRHQGSAQLSYFRDGTLASFGFRSHAAQFEDDQNRFLLPGFATVQLAVKQRLTGSLSATLAMENILDREYVVGFSPTPMVGPPRLWRVGLRWDGRLW